MAEESDATGSTHTTGRLLALIGPARSGTTWAGTILDSDEDLIYRFEPFHRLAAVDNRVADWFARLRKGQLRHEELDAIYLKLCRAHPLTNKEPFFRAKSYAVNTAGRRQLWPLARVFRPCAALYESLYSPVPGPPLLFKEVTFVRPLENLLRLNSVPVIYMLRNPCASITSSINVQMRDGTTARLRMLRQTLMDQAPDLAEQFEDVLSGQDVVSQAALLWRYEVAMCVGMVRRSSKAIVVTYEQLAQDSQAIAKSMFKHFGLTYGDQTERYVTSLLSLGDESRSRRRRTGWGSKDFSIYRNPQVEKDAWKSRISSTDREKIERIVQGPADIEYCAALGKWW